MQLTPGSEVTAAALYLVIGILNKKLSCRIGCNKKFVPVEGFFEVLVDEDASSERMSPSHRDAMFIYTYNYMCSSGVSQRLLGFANVMSHELNFPLFGSPPGHIGL